MSSSSILRSIGPDLWQVRAELALAAGIRLPGAMFVARDAGALAVISPLGLETGWPEVVADLGEVRFLIAPNLFHHLYLGPASEHFPDAVVCGPRRLAKKRRGLRIDAFLEDGPPPGWPESIETIPIEGAPAIGELAFHHRPSRTLIVTDLLFHMTEPPPNFRTRAFVRLTSGWGRVAQSKAWKMLARDRAALRASFGRLAELDLDRIAPCHGELIEDPAAALALLR